MVIGLLQPVEEFLCRRTPVRTGIVAVASLVQGEVAPMSSKAVKLIVSVFVAGKVYTLSYCS